MYQCCFKLLNITGCFFETWGTLLNTLMPKKWSPFWYRDRFAGCWWKLSFCLVFTLWMLECKLYMLLLSTTNNRSESMYCEWNGNIFKCENKSLQESLFLLSVIILISFFCILKIFVLSVVSPVYYSIWHSGVKVGIVNHFHYFLRLVGFNRSECITSLICHVWYVLNM
jgi:hypothetical protein